jgi:putative restriction endonuclease
MTPLERLRIEKAASDCGFEMTPLEREGGLELRSVHFPEAVVVRSVGELLFEVASPVGLALNVVDANLPINARGYEELYELLRTAASRGRTLPNRIADAFRHATADMPRTTEADRLVVARVGQTMFRAALLDYWQGRCCITGLEVPELLRASHIKPWASCERDDERLDVFNGLLLAPHLDAMFDAGWMTVTLGGEVEISPSLSVQARETLGVSQPLKVHRIRPEHAPYLAFHRGHVYRRGL